MKGTDILAAIILLVLSFLVVALPTLALGIGLGYALWAVIPGLDLGWAVVAGAVFAVGIADMTGRLLHAMRDVEPPSDKEEATEDEEPWVAIAPHLFHSRTPRKRPRKRR